MEIYNSIIIGGGASGLCAATALNGSVLVLEAGERVGKKLLATGNGKCNLTNFAVSPDKYNNPSFVSGVLAEYNTQEIASFFEDLGLILREEEGRYYPYSETASSVLDVLRLALDKKNVKICVGQKVVGIKKANESFEVSSENCTYLSQNVIFACGSKAGFGLQS